jgi:hypothetical protein
MLASMPGRVLGEWMAYASLEPFGEGRADLRMGILAALTANVNRDPDKCEPFKAEDLMPDFAADKTPHLRAADKTPHLRAAEVPSDREQVARQADAYFTALAEIRK